MKETLIEVIFTHPRASTSFPAEVSPETTADQAVSELVKANFIEAPSGALQYVLVHQGTGTMIPANSTFASVGVKAKDIIAVTAKTSGAGH